MKLHWKILLWMLGGALVGTVFQLLLAAPPWIGLEVEGQGDAVVVTKVVAGSPAEKKAPGGGAVTVGSTWDALVLDRGAEAGERRSPLRSADDLAAALAEADVGSIVWLEAADGRAQPITVAMQPGSPRDNWLEPFRFIATIFLALLKMLIVPIIVTSIVCGVANVGSGREFGRLGAKTFGYYVCTSFLAIFTGLLLVNLLRPGTGAPLGLPPTDKLGEAQEESFLGIFVRMVPENVFAAMGENGQMLQVIFFALLFGFFLTRTPEPHGSRMKGIFESAFEVMMNLAIFVLGLIPYGVFALLVKVVGETGFGMFKALGVYMITVALGLILHATVVLPLVLRFIGGVSPRKWVRACGPALMTAFSTSSSSLTLPVTLETVEKRGRVSGRVASFSLPLGATINMDGTALYECVGVIFLAQYYSSIPGMEFDLTLADQALVVMMALMASIGAAGIPSAGLVMMLTILHALGLPIEGAALLLAVDRPLDMMRTTVNVWSDTCAAAIIARSEGETDVGKPLPAAAG